MDEETEKKMQNHSEERAPNFSAEELFIKRIGSCPYHKCLTGRGVCFMATRAPPQSRNQTLYSSSKIWNNNSNSNHSNALHLQCLTVYTLSHAWFRLDSSVSWGSCGQSDKYYLHLLDEKLDSQRKTSSPYPTQMANSGPFLLAMQIMVHEGEAIWCMRN